MQSAKPHDPYAALRYRNFRYFVSAKFSLTLALQMQAVVMSWFVYEKTHDPLSLGFIGLIEAVPALSIALFGGHLADRLSRKKIMIWATLATLAASVFLVIYTADKSHVSVLPIYITVFLIGVARGFHSPTQAAFWGQVVPTEHYVNASTWNSSTWQIGAVVGPAIGGFFYGWFGAFASALVVCAFIIITLIYYLLMEEKHVDYKNQQESIKESLMKGIRFVFKNQLIISAISLDLFAVLFGGAVALLPIFADKILHTGPQGLGILRAAPAVGAVVMALWLAYNPPRHNAGKKLLACVAGFGLCIIAFALSENFWLSFALLFISGALDNVSVVIRATILQTFTPDEMRGRVSAVNSIFVGSSNEIGGFESGLTAKIFGLIPSVILGGSMTLLIVFYTFFKAEKLKQLDFK
jgi:MFS family permease